MDSACSPSVVLERIAARTDPQNLLDSRPNPTEQAYEGCVEAGAFRIRPAWPGRRHSFRVFIEGQVEPHGAGSRVYATVHLDRGTVVFFVVIALVIAGAVLTRPLILGLDRPTWVFWLVYGVGGALAWLALMTAYWAGLGGARRFLTAAVTADPATRPVTAATKDSG